MLSSVPKYSIYSMM